MDAPIIAAPPVSRHVAAAIRAAREFHAADDFRRAGEFFMSSIFRFARRTATTRAGGQAATPRQISSRQRADDDAL